MECFTSMIGKFKDTSGWKPDTSHLESLNWIIWGKYFVYFCSLIELRLILNIFFKKI